VPPAALDGLELHYEERGSGRPLLLIAGIPAIASDWAPFADSLATSRRVIAYDNRGSGASTVTPGPYTTAQLAGDAVALLDHLGVERADVLGVSLGGMIAQELVLGRPERVDHLVLGCTHCGVAHAPRMSRDTGRAFATKTDDWAERMRALAPFAFAETVDPERCGGSSRRSRVTSRIPRATGRRSPRCCPTTRSRACRRSSAPP
jgi:3-oxoadipate enol-lactonase